mmetsp:Transcript_22555/g.60501  ORF Transcript_22555/g.60501 Transcript_22555/m.60501 type:complete len:591 (-) Transcript_22555:112-1884(-)
MKRHGDLSQLLIIGSAQPRRRIPPRDGSKAGVALVLVVAKDNVAEGRRVGVEKRVDKAHWRPAGPKPQVVELGDDPGEDGRRRGGAVRPVPVLLDGDAVRVLRAAQHGNVRVAASRCIPQLGGRQVAARAAAVGADERLDRRLLIEGRPHSRREATAAAAPRALAVAQDILDLEVGAADGGDVGRGARVVRVEAVAVLDAGAPPDAHIARGEDDSGAAQPELDQLLVDRVHVREPTLAEGRVVPLIDLVVAVRDRMDEGQLAVGELVQPDRPPLDRVLPAVVRAEGHAAADRLDHLDIHHRLHAKAHRAPHDGGAHLGDVAAVVVNDLERRDLALGRVRVQPLLVPKLPLERSDRHRAVRRLVGPLAEAVLLLEHLGRDGAAALVGAVARLAAVVGPLVPQVRVAAAPPERDPPRRLRLLRPALPRAQGRQAQQRRHQRDVGRHAPRERISARGTQHGGQLGVRVSVDLRRQQLLRQRARERAHVDRVARLPRPHGRAVDASGGEKGADRRHRGGSRREVGDLGPGEVPAIIGRGRVGYPVQRLAQDLRLLGRVLQHEGDVQRVRVGAAQALEPVGSLGGRAGRHVWFER